MVCGTVSHKDYKINLDKTSKSHNVSISSGYSSNSDFNESCKLGGLLKDDTVTFLNDSNSFNWNGNSNFTGELYVYPEYLKIKRQNKFGIYAYKYKNCEFYDPILNKMELDYGIKTKAKPETQLTPEVLMSIQYDSIVFNKQNGLIYFYKQNKVGLFPRHKNVTYDKLKQKTQSFYSIIKNEKQGWLDIKTNEEFYNEPE